MIFSKKRLVQGNTWEKKIKDATKQIEWLESMRELNNATKVEKFKLITMKISPSLLEAFKLKCEIEKRP